MPGSPRLWEVPSGYIARGGAYPGTGDSIGLAITSPELSNEGLYDDGGQVGDPPYDSMQASYYEDSIGASAGPGAGAGGVSGGSSLNGHILAGAISAIVLFGSVYYIHHHVTDRQKGHSAIRWTLGEVALVTVAAAAGTPILKTFLTRVGGWVPLFAPLSDYVNGA